MNTLVYKDLWIIIAELVLDGEQVQRLLISVNRVETDGNRPKHDRTGDKPKQRAKIHWIERCCKKRTNVV